ncbi:hypothetical protein CHS0354_022411 [Potamilus streckersoni]|uniref:Neurexin n=1 Tax=Potamilus streckersoni TaxID=2493646 RepID=A0AAE0SXD6_9BIVA|nr:hypothetical protein CHS0354_022411 [Potamilus streckersoni]
MRNLKYKQSDGTLVDIPVETIDAVLDNCYDLCSDKNPCHHDGRCVNKYSEATCDCFGTDYEGKLCQTFGSTIVTLRGYEWLTYMLHQKTDQILTSRGRFSLEFKTKRGSGVLLYAAGGTPYHSHVTASIHGGIVTVSIAIGNEDIEVQAGIGVDDYSHQNSARWHNLTIIHEKRLIYVYLDGREKSRSFTRENYHLGLDPKVYIGGGDNFVVTRGLQVTNNFVGCLKNVYINDVSVLYALSDKDRRAQYHGGRAGTPHYTCEEVINIPISFPEANAMLLLDSDLETRYTLDVEFDFRTVRYDAILFYAELLDRDIINGNDYGYVEVWVYQGRPMLLFVPSTKKSDKNENLTIPCYVNNNDWHSLQVTFKYREASLKVDGMTVATSQYHRNLEIFGKIVIGSSLRSNRFKALTAEGFVGCIRGLVVQKQAQDPLDMMESEGVNGLKLDGCHIVNYCEGNDMCEHGGRCLSDWNGVTCDCTNTAYTGKACHFPKYRQSCEDYFLAGVDQSGVRLIDLDGSGPIKPTYVECIMGYEYNEEKYGRTVVTHNLEPNTTVRGYMLQDMRKVIEYRGMDREQLVKLTQISGWCEQYLQYDCKKAPIRLGTLTWFKAANGEIVEYLGTSDKHGGHCICSLSDTCPSQKCNCDADNDKWQRDDGYNRINRQLPLTEMTIKQNPNPLEPGRAFFTLGPLYCWGKRNERAEHAVTFKSEKGYLLSHPWRSDSLRIGFKTHNQHATLLYHMGTKDNPNYFIVTITSANKVVFFFSWGKEQLEIEILMKTLVSDGNWHLIIMDYDQYNIRCIVDMHEEVANIPEGVDKVLDFDGALYIGGINSEVTSTENNRMASGLVGCMRGLVYNGVETPLNRLIDSSTHDVTPQCMTSCWPNPCKNGAECVEKWGSHQCICVNKWAHYGEDCEIDINVDAVTFTGAEASYLLFKEPPSLNLLDSSIIFSFRTFQQNTLLLYLHDNLNNFVQVELTDEGNGSYIVVKFNRFNNIIKLAKPTSGLGDGQWHQVAIVNTDGYFKLFVDTDKVFNGSSYQKQKLTKYTDKPFPATDENVIPKRPANQPEDLIHIYVGGVGPNMTNLPPLYGCIRGLKIGDTLFEMQKAAEKYKALSAACDNGCSPNPCLNKGICMDLWQNKKYKCNCSLIAFAGERCHLEASGHFAGESIVQYKFSPPPLFVAVMEKLDLVFKVESTATHMMILTFIYSERHSTHDFIVVYLDPRSGVYVQVNQGYAIHGVGKPGNFADGKPHHLLYRHSGNEMVLSVRKEDHHKFRNTSLSLDEEGIGRVTVPNSGLDELDTILVGGIPQAVIQNIPDAMAYAKYANFTGCISDFSFYLVWNVQKEPIQLQPLKDLRTSGATEFIEVFGPQLGECSTRPITTDVIQTTSMFKVPSTDSPTLTMPPWKPGPAQTIYIGPSPKIPEQDQKTMTTNLTPTSEKDVAFPAMTQGSADIMIIIVALTVVGILILLSLLVALLLCKIRRRQKKYAVRKFSEDYDVKQPLNDTITGPDRFNNHLATLDEFSMISATIGPRRHNETSTFKPEEGDKPVAYTGVPKSDDTGYVAQVFYNRRKNRPASSISEVLEEMDRQRQAKESGVDNTSESPMYEVLQGSNDTDREWAPQRDRTPLTCPNEDCRNAPIPEGQDEEGEGDIEHPDHHSINSLLDNHPGMEYNGDSGYEAESKQDVDEEDEDNITKNIPNMSDSNLLNGFSEETSPSSPNSKDFAPQSGKTTPSDIVPRLKTHDIMKFREDEDGPVFIVQSRAPVIPTRDYSSGEFT